MPLKNRCIRLCMGLLIFLSSPCLLIAQVQPAEICDNAIDDDGDGFIDLNDSDCDCPVIEPISLIPNPSFEDQNCCPSSRSQMNCAKDWIQASEATTDYLHECGWSGWPGLPVPLPIPDGNACIGYRDGRFGNNGSNPNWKEYTGACLLAPLRAGVQYKFQFYIGFTNSINSPPTNVTFFGSTDCANLPFGKGNAEFGCPTNGPGWKFMGSVPANASNSWVQREINLTPEEDIYAIAIGPPCRQLSASGSIYYFFDNLILAEQAAFDFQINQTAHSCAEDLTLEMPQHDSLAYQWYKDGIALLGETHASLSRMYGDGIYQVWVESPAVGCRITEPYIFGRPQMMREEKLTICEGDDYFFGQRYINQSGTYMDTLKTAENCDSIIRLNLDVYVDQADTVNAKIYPREYYQLGDRSFFVPGQHQVTFHTQEGCDSTVFLNLEHYKAFIPNAFTPNNDGINDLFTIMGNEDLVAISQFKVFNRWGNLVFEGVDLLPNHPGSGWDGRTRGGGFAPEGVYMFSASLLYDDGKERITSGSLTLLR